MTESPAFARTYDLLLWLVPRSLKFPRHHRFGLARRLQDAAYALQRAFVEAALAPNPPAAVLALQRADVELTEVRLCMRLSHDLGLLDEGGYEHSSQMLAEIGRLLGGWKKKTGSVKGTKAPLDLV